VLTEDKGDPLLEKVVQTPRGGAKEMQEAIVAVEIETSKSAKGGDAEHLGGAEKAQNDHDKVEDNGYSRLMKSARTYR